MPKKRATGKGGAGKKQQRTSAPKKAVKSWSPKIHPHTRAGSQQRRTQEVASIEELEPAAVPSGLSGEVSRLQDNKRSKGEPKIKLQPTEQAKRANSAITEPSRHRTQPSRESSRVLPNPEASLKAREPEAKGRDTTTRGRGPSTRGRPTSTRGARGRPRGRGASTRGRALAGEPSGTRGSTKQGRALQRVSRGTGLRGEANNPSETHPIGNAQATGIARDLAFQDQDQNQSVHIGRWFEGTETVRQLRSHRNRSLNSNAQPENPISGLHNMQDSSSASQGQTSRARAQSTATTIRADNKLTDEKLRTRRVIRDPEKDPRRAFLKSLIQTKLPALSLSETPELEQILDQHMKELKRNQPLSYYAFIDSLCFDLDKNKKEVGCPIILSKYFEELQRKCNSQNEAMLQRTIMINTFHTYWLNEMLDYNTEGIWNLPRDMCLPSTSKSTVRMPKPDLVISFKISKFTSDADGADPIPASIAQCLFPDGGFRCFPFLFMEVKKAGADLIDAKRDNLYNASQALYNMYQWMKEASEEDLFFEKVRVLSIVFNAEDLSVRVHRAAPSETKGALRFVFDDLYVLSQYTRDEACLLLNSLLENYAIKELHPILKRAFTAVVQKTQLEEQSRSSKRTTTDNTQGDSSSKKRRTSVNGNQNQHTGQSFEASRLYIA